jgi:hypothetical protein
VAGLTEKLAGLEREPGRIHRNPQWPWDTTLAAVWYSRKPHTKKDGTAYYQPNKKTGYYLRWRVFA